MPSLAGLELPAFEPTIRVARLRFEHESSALPIELYSLPNFLCIRITYLIWNKAKLYFNLLRRN